MLSAHVETAMEMDRRARVLQQENPDIVESAWAEAFPVITALYAADLPALAEAGQHMADVARRRGDAHAEQFALSTQLVLLSQDADQLDRAIGDLLEEAAPGGPMWTGNVLASAVGALMAGPPGKKRWRTVLEILDQYPSWRESGYVLRKSIMAVQAAALTLEDPAGAVSVALEVVHETDRIGGHHIAIGSLEAAALAAAKLGERDHAARLFRHAAATAPFLNPWSAWIREETVERLAAMGIDQGSLAPHELGRTQLFGTFADLERSYA